MTSKNWKQGQFRGLIAARPVGRSGWNYAANDGDKVMNGGVICSISLIIPTFNRAGLLEKALASVAMAVNASQSKIEVVIINNNSTDETPAVVDKARRGFPCPLRCVLETRQGLSYARNRGLAEAKGYYIVYMDDDQLMDRDYLQKIPLAFSETRADCVGGRVTYYNANDLPPWLAELSQTIGQTSCGDEVRILDSNTTKGLFGGNMAIVRSVLVAAGGFNVELGRSANDQATGEDFELQDRLRDLGKVVAYYPALVQYHYLRPERYKKSYWRGYFFDYGRSVYKRSQHRESALRRTLWRVPLWLLRVFVTQECPAYLRALWSFDSIKIFRRELDLWALVGQMRQARLDSVGVARRMRMWRRAPPRK